MQFSTTSSAAVQTSQTKSFCTRKEFNPHKTVVVNQHGHHFGTIIWSQKRHIINFRLQVLGFYDSVRGLGGLINGGLLTSGRLYNRTKYRFKTSCIALLIKIRYEGTYFFKLQNVAKTEFISIQARKELIPRGGTACVFLFTV